MSDSNENTGFVAPDPADLAPLFPGYEIQGLIATGGMGAVYCAVQKSLDRTVALKILPRELSKDAAFCAGFEAEAKAMARLNHPNLIGVYDFGEVNGMLFIIMEYVPGQSLYHSAYGIRVDQQEVIRMVSGICHGLAHAHENGILHRDIKPSNILLDLNAEPKIGDFGLARPVGSTIEEGEEIFGTPHYTAPEVVSHPHSVDYRADIFSVGVLLHELLTGHLPAEDPRPASVIARCDPRFDAIIRKATQPLPAARYSSAKEIADDLQAIASARVPRVPHAPAAPGHRSAPRVRGHVHGRTVAKKSSGSGFLVFLIAAAAAGGIAYFIHSSNPPPVDKPIGSDVEIVSKDKDVEPPKEDTPNRIDTTIPPVTPRPSGGDDSAVTGNQDTDETEIDETPVVEVPELDGNDTTYPAPKADVIAFFDRARGIMRDKAKIPIAARDLALKQNFAGFESSLKRQLAKYKTGAGPSDKVLTAALEGWRSSGARVPDSLDSELSSFPEIELLRAEYALKQTGLEDTCNEAISKLSALYIIGLQKQNERYQADGDAGAVHVVESEITTSQEDPDYFTNKILGLAADKDSGMFEDEDEDQDE